jgi:hypothetical protein
MEDSLPGCQYSLPEAIADLLVETHFVYPSPSSKEGNQACGQYHAPSTLLALRGQCSTFF